jgi:hypothetical protein
MARHNRDAKGVDQHGELWHISYQPDWLKRVKISRKLPRGGRRSMLTLFRNPARRARAEAGKSVRTRIAAADGSADFEISLEDRNDVVESITVKTRRKRGRRWETINFVLHDGMPPPRA